MQRFWEFILGLDPGFLARQGDFSIQFNPKWPMQASIGAGVWNPVLSALSVLLIIYVYRREARSRTARVILGILRGALLAFVILLLNRPSLLLAQTRSEPSYLAVLIDSSISMQVRDAGVSEGDKQGIQRFEAVMRLLDDDSQQFVRKLAGQHI